MAQAEKHPLPSIAPGTLLAGKYRAVRTLATGGMGVVVLVKHEVLGQRAALKILRSDAVTSRDAAERFLREARASANLKSDHVVRVFDVGSLDGVVPYMLMEYLDGRDLADELRRRGRLPVSEAVDYVLQAIDAIAEAHGVGVIHRDIKPSNLFVTTRADGVRNVKVLDFGISKVVPGIGELTDGAVTTDNALLGSPAYMSPEQVKSSKDVDGRTDVWSLGVVLYELMTGERAFDGETVGSILSQILCEDVPPITRFVPDAPPGLDRVVVRCLERNRELRYESVLALHDALMPFATDRTRLSLPPRASMPPAAAEITIARTPVRAISDETTVDVSSERPGVESTIAVSADPRGREQGGRAPPPLAPRSRARLLAAGAAALFVVGTIWFVGHTGGPPEPAAPAPPATTPIAPAPTALPSPAGALSGAPAVSAAPTVTPVEPSATASTAASSASSAAVAPPPRPKLRRPVAPRPAPTLDPQLDQRN